MAYLKHLAIISSLFLFMPDLSAQVKKSECACQAILIPVNKAVKLFDHPDRKIIAGIKNDSVTENYFSFDITETNRDWSKVIAYSLNDKKYIGWIQNKYLGVYSRNYGTTHLSLYTKPAKTSAVKMIVNDEACSEPWHIVTCSGKWLYVSCGNDKKYEGWLEPEMQCANPYTTCN